MISNKRSYAGGEITDLEIVEKLPQTYRNLLQQVNGCRISEAEKVIKRLESGMPPKAG